jgi:uncharacterized protein (DUF2267 family)
VAEPGFIESVADRARTPIDVAEALTEATLRTLAQHLTRGEAADLAARMPERLRPSLMKATEPAESFSSEEFIRRVAESAGVDRVTAERGVVGVLRAMRGAVGQKEFKDALAQLPKEFRTMAAGMPVPF